MKDFKIIQISTCQNPNAYSEDHITFGLGNDNKLYWWSSNHGKWILDFIKKLND